MIIRGVSDKPVISEVGGQTVKARAILPSLHERDSQSDHGFCFDPLGFISLTVNLATPSSVQISLHNAVLCLAHYSSGVVGIKTLCAGDIVGWESASPALGGSR